MNILSKITPKLLKRINPLSDEESSKAQAAVIAAAIAAVANNPVLSVIVIVVWIVAQAAVEFAQGQSSEV